MKEHNRLLYVKEKRYQCYIKSFNRAVGRNGTRFLNLKIMLDTPAGKIPIHHVFVENAGYNKKMRDFLIESEVLGKDGTINFEGLINCWYEADAYYDEDGKLRLDSFEFLGVDDGEE